MKFTQREKILAVCLGLIVLIFVYYWFVFKPQQKLIATLKNQAAANDQLIIGIKDFLDPNGKLPHDYKIMKAKADEQTRMFFPLADQEKTILAIDQMLTAGPLGGLAISFGDVQLAKSITNSKAAGQLGYYLKGLVEDEVKAGPGAKAAASAGNDKEQIPSVDLTLQYSGPYTSLLSFLSSVESWEKKMFVKSILITPSKNPQIVNGNIVFRLFMLPKYPGSDSDFLSWDINGTYGSANPYVLTAGAATASAPTVNKEAAAPVTADFVLSMKPLTADLPAVVLGKSKDYTRTSYVYSDSPDFVNTSIKVTQKDGKYNFQYQTQNDSYPKDGSLEVFQPLGQSVTLLIYSTPRNQENDQNGINLALTNETGSPLVVQVLNDDPAKPRVVVTKRSGDVQIR